MTNTEQNKNKIKQLTVEFVKKTLKKYCDAKQDLNLSADEILGQNISYRDTPTLDEVRIISYFKHEFIETTLCIAHRFNGRVVYYGNMNISTKYLTSQDWDGKCFPNIVMDENFLTESDAIKELKEILTAIIVKQEVTDVAHFSK